MSKVAERIKVSSFVDGSTLCSVKTTLPLPEGVSPSSTSIFSEPGDGDQLSAMAYGVQSTTAKSRTLKLGDNMAPMSAQPLDTASSELSVR
jgi:hypothetical protein